MMEHHHLPEEVARPKVPTVSPSHSLLIRAPLSTEEDHSEDSTPSDAESFLTGDGDEEEGEEGGFVPKARVSGFDDEWDEEYVDTEDDGEEEGVMFWGSEEEEKRCLAVEKEDGDDDKEGEGFESSEDHAGEVMEGEGDGASASTDSGGVDVESVNDKPGPEEQTVIAVEADSYPSAVRSTSVSYRGMSPVIAESCAGPSGYMDSGGVDVESVNVRPGPEPEEQTVIAVEADSYPSAVCSTSVSYRGMSPVIAESCAGPSGYMDSGGVDVESVNVRPGPEPEELTSIVVEPDSYPSLASSISYSYCGMSPMIAESCAGPSGYMDSGVVDVESVNVRPEPEEQTLIAVEADSYPLLASSISDSYCGMSPMIAALCAESSLDLQILKLDSIFVGDFNDLQDDRMDVNGAENEEHDFEGGGGGCDERIVSESNDNKVEELSMSLLDTTATGVLHHLEQLTCRINDIIPAPANMDDDDLEFSCNILLIGKTGVGKSALINSIFGDDIAPTSPFRPATTCVKEFTGTADGIKLRVMDTPGLSSCAMDIGPNRKILTLIKKRMNKNFVPDCVLYVDRLNDPSNDLPLLKLISHVLGSSIWHNTIVLLTHAGSPPPDEEPNHDVFVEKRYNAIQDCIWQAAGKDDAVSLSLALAENHHPSEMVLPNCLNWRPQLLLLCCSLKMVSQARCLMEEEEPWWHRKFWAFLSNLVVHTT